MKNSIKFLFIGSGVILLLMLTNVIGIMGAIGLFLIIGLVLAIMSSNESQKERNGIIDQLSKELDAINGFTPTKRLVRQWGYIAIDESNRKIAFKAFMKPRHVVGYQDIIGCEIIENGETIFRKSGTLGRAVVGGVIAGEAGALVGGMSAKGKEIREVKTAELKILIRNTDNPSFRLRFFDAWEDSGQTRKSIKYSDSVYGPILRKAIDNLNTWKETIEVIIDQMDRSVGHESSPNKSLADELIKLNDLKIQGVLTAEEFEREKSKLLGT